ncbi:MULTISPECIES: hypothetical protein [Caldimonas]|jgi:hypothetical protein|uniref:hypothetical protein n=1 Tax=Caldimonas TaxID=196013 RepID=UPI00037872DF|nr:MULTISPECIES: hypothetical protein [Caldimonas]MCX7660106.1 hypothetical protein [Caldimonas manganoxidans]GIX23510.1 MAG: lipoprotein [Caldimonas sp.]
MSRRPLVALGLGLVVGLAACGQTEQTAKAPLKGSDSPAWQGAANPFVAPGWKPGDPAAWQEQMRRRVAGQNEYSRIN